VEAAMSIHYGIKSFELESAINELEKIYKNKIFYNIHLDSFFNQGFLK
jgi:putative hydrolase of HD superfamily